MAPWARRLATDCRAITRACSAVCCRSTAATHRHGIRYCIVDQNPKTVATQRELGRTAVQGDISDPQTLEKAGIAEASILALTIPDEQAVLRAVATARPL